jgi:hypothetical protein
MTYEPQEGVDYLVDLYAVAAVPQETEQDALKQALNDRLKEYHPDRLEGLAPEFRSKGERMARLLNRAKVVLLNPVKRSEYDEILSSWDKPVSKDGTPVVTIGRHSRAEAALRSPEEVEAGIMAQIPQIESMTGYSAAQLSFLEKMVEQAGDDVSDDLREAYEEALLRQDRALGIEEANRGDLLNLPSLEGSRYVATLDYADEKILAIETARAVQKEELVMAALGGVGTRLALLAGESAPEPSTTLVSPGSIELPAYFDEQAKKVQEIAEKRQAIVEKRLANFKPTYPEAEMQTEVLPALALGFGPSERRSWFGFVVDREGQSVNAVDISEEIKQLLASQDYTAVIRSGFNVITFEPMDQIDLREQLDAAVEDYIDKYKLFPDEE